MTELEELKREVLTLSVEVKLLRRAVQEFRDMCVSCAGFGDDGRDNPLWEFLDKK